MSPLKKLVGSSVSNFRPTGKRNTQKKRAGKENMYNKTECTTNEPMIVSYVRTAPESRCDLMLRRAG